MLKRLRNIFARESAPPTASIPAGQRVYAVGDIHGRLDLFEALIEGIETDDAAAGKAETTVILLGDLVDRGADSAGVVARAREWQKQRTVRILAGNHEEMFLDSFDDADTLRHFLRFGGKETVLSYGIDRRAYNAAEIEEVQAMMRDAVPQGDRDFLASFEDMVAIQGGIDIGHESGFYVGTWGSSIDGGAYGSIELDVYGGWAGEVTPGIELDVGLLYYMYPNGLAGADLDYWEPYASISTSLGPVGATAGVAYAWDQDSLGGSDNLYLYTDFEVGIPQTPLTFSAHLGYTDGVLAPPLLSGLSLDDSGFDYSVGVSATVLGGLSVGVQYIDTEGPSVDDFTDSAVVGTLSFSF